MPNLPKWLADGLEKTFASMMHPVKVSEIESVASGLQRVVFEGDLTTCRYQPGSVIDFRVSDQASRHYTPSRFSTEQGFCEVLFYVHGEAPGTAWVKNLKLGQQVKLMGPGGHLRYQTSFKQHFVFGDESVLGLARALQTAALQDGKQGLALFELEAEHQHWPQLLQLQAETVVKSAQPPAQASLAFLNAWLQQHQAGDTCFYLSGRAQSIQALLRLLRQHGVSRRQIQSEPYWADGKKGL